MKQPVSSVYNSHCEIEIQTTPNDGFLDGCIGLVGKRHL
jgi:hypothetical protein